MNSFSFDDLIGNSMTVTLLKRSLEKKSFSQFSCFSGTLGTGKSTSAKITALALTCEHAVNGQPCLKCSSCKSNLRAFETNGESLNVKVVNMGKFSKKDDITALIKDIFVLQSGYSNKVYIFEEAHALKDIHGAQTAFLEEIDRMPLNTYIIMCTTRVNDLLPELRSRSTNFSFGRLNNKESIRLVEKYAEETYAKRLPANVVNLIVSSSKGIPRDLLKSVDFIVKNSITEEELKEYLQTISDATFITLFQSMKQADMCEFSRLLNDLFESRDASTVLEQLRSFLLKAIFFIEGGIKDDLTRVEQTDLKNLFTYQVLMKIANVIDNLHHNVNQDVLRLALLKIRLLMQDRTMTSVLTENQRVGAAEKGRANRLQQEIEQLTNNPDKVVLKKLTASSLDSF